MKDLKQLERAIKKQQKLVDRLYKEKKDYTRVDFSKSSFEWVMADTILQNLKLSLDYVKKVQKEFDYFN